MDLAREFPIDSDIAYLNHAAVAPWPVRASDQVTNFARENTLLGARHYPDWLKVEASLRSNLGKLINAPSSADVALVKNTSEALSFVAQGLAWQAGDEIVISDQEFPSNRIVWEALQKQGVRVREIPLAPVEQAEENLIQALSPRTRLLAISSVQYGNGLRLDLKKLGRACREAGVLFCVDGIQSIGAQPLDVQAMQIDFTMADGHKWLLGPEGLGLFYVRPELRDNLRLTEFGWHMVKNRGNFDQREWQVAEDATRFECGSPNTLGAHALQASTSLLLEYGMEAVTSELDRRVLWLNDALREEPGIDVISPMSEPRRSGIITFQTQGIDSQSLYRGLMEDGVICACRGGGVRFSPHFYTPIDRLELAMARLRTRIGSLQGRN